MPQLAIETQTQSGQTMLDHGISDVLIHDTGNGAVLYTTSGQSGGVSAYSIGTNGDLTLIDFAHFSAAWSEDVLPSLSIVQTVSGPQLVVAGDGEGDLTAYALDASGMLMGVGAMSGLVAGNTAVLDVDQWGSDMLFLANSGTGSIEGYEIGNGNALTRTMAISDTGTTYADSVFALDTLSIAGSDFLIGASPTDQGVTAYKIGAGGLEATGSLGIEEGLGIMTPTDLQTAVVDGRSFVLVGSSPGDGIGQSGAITVMELLPDGSLVPTDHVIDTMHTRFGQVQSLDVVDVDGRTYVVAGGGDDGLTVFVLMPNGRLQIIDAMADTFAAGLENVSSVDSFHQGSKLHMFVSSEIAPGVTEVTLSTESQGNTYIQQSAGGTANGSSQNDIMLGGSGNDVLVASYGDDILEDGAGADTMTGGGGLDTFVLRGDGEADLITDFEYHRDSLDLSDWPFLYDMSQLTVTPTSLGAVLTWRGEYLELQTANGQSLTVAQVLGAILDAPNRPPNLAQVGNGGGDQLQEGAPGQDDLDGGAGDDTLYGYDGDDTLAGGGGNDSLVGGNGADVLSGNDDADVLTGGTGNDIFYGGAGDDTLEGGDDIDRLYGDDDNDALFGGGANDQLFGGDGDDTAYGDDGADRIYGQQGRDNLTGGTGNDMIRGGADNDMVDGEDDSDNLTGDAGNDTMFGRSGNDRLQGGLDDDRMWGGDGHDRMWGNEGIDTVYGEAGIDRIWGGDGDDQLFGGDDNDQIHGGTGNDTLKGGNDIDRLYGDDDADQLFGQGSNDQLYGGRGDDIANGGDGADRIYGEQGDDNLVGSTGNDLIRGGADNDTVNGGDDNDNMTGDAGSDTMDGGNGNDRLQGGLDNDRMLGGADHDRIWGDEGADTIYGETGNDRIWGGAGDDLIFGGDHNDLIYGGIGADTLDGGTGNEQLWGDDGSDVFVFANGHGNDRIKDFDALDANEKIDLSAVSSLGNISDILGVSGPGSGAAVVIGGGVRIDTGAGNWILLEGVDINDLDASDFIF